MDLDERTQGLLEEFKQSEVPSPETAGRSWEAIEGRLEAGGGGMADPASSGPTWVYVAGGIVAATALIGLALWPEGEQAPLPAAPEVVDVATAVPVPEPAATLTPSPSPGEGAGEELASADQPDEGPRVASDSEQEAQRAEHSARARAAARHKPAEKPEPSAGSIDDEIAMIAAGRRALRDGQPARALELAKKHAAEFPRGDLVDERKLLKMQALCDLGRVDEARKAVDRFLAAKPNAAISPKVRRVCE